MCTGGNSIWNCSPCVSQIGRKKLESKKAQASDRHLPWEESVSRVRRWPNGTFSCAKRCPTEPLSKWNYPLTHQTAHNLALHSCFLSVRHMLGVPGAAFQTHKCFMTAVSFLSLIWTNISYMCVWLLRVHSFQSWGLGLIFKTNITTTGSCTG